MSKKTSSTSNFFTNIAILIIKALIILLILVVVGVPIYVIWRHPPPPEIQTVEAEVNRLWIEQIESNTGGSQIRRIEFKQRQGKKFVCKLAPFAIQVWNQLEVGQTYQIEVTWAGTRCYLHEATAVN